jgi:hypothetical protein
MGGHKPKAIFGDHHAFLVPRIREREFTVRGRVAELARRGFKVEYRPVWNFVPAETLCFKRTVVASERDRPNIARRRARWTKRQKRIAPERLVFIDWSSSTRHGRRPTWRGAGDGRRKGRGSLPKFRTATGKP